MRGYSSIYMTPEGKRLKRDYQLEARSQYRGFLLKEPLSQTLRFYFKTKRRRDIDNHNKLVLDALNGIVYADDSQIRALHTFFDYDATKPRVEITIH